MPFTLANAVLELQQARAFSSSLGLTAQGQVDLRQSIPGLGKHGSEELLAEIGADMRVFPSPANLASWVGVAPGAHASAGVKKRVKTRPGNRYAKRDRGHVRGPQQVDVPVRLVPPHPRPPGLRQTLVATQHSIVTAI